MPASNVSYSGEHPDITLQDALNLNLISIARTRAGLSKLVDGEAEEIQLIADCNPSFQDVADINQSINRILRDAIRLKMLLQFKFEDIIRVPGIIPDSAVHKKIAEASPAATSSIPQIAELQGENEKSAEKSRATAGKNAEYSIIGRGVGIVSNQQDLFRNGIAIAQTCIYNKNINMEDSFLYYSVHKETTMQIISVLPASLKIDRLAAKGSKKVVVQGMGTIIYKERFKPDILDSGSFLMTICHADSKFIADSFHIAIKANRNPEFNHDSGEINLEFSDLTIGTL